MKELTLSKVLVLIAVLCFVLATFGVSFGVSLLPLGLAFFAAASLV